MAEPFQPLLERPYEQKQGLLWIPIEADKYPWPKGLKQGRPFLINDTFVRVDGIDYVIVRARHGKFQPIEVITPIGETLIQTPKCEGYVFAPIPRWMNERMAEQNSLRRRCMTAGEVVDAEKDHTVVRLMRDTITNAVQGDYHSMKGQGDNDTHIRLLAFNTALQNKRLELARKQGKNYDWEKLIKSTYKDGWFTLFPDKIKGTTKIDV